MKRLVFALAVCSACGCTVVYRPVPVAYPVYGQPPAGVIVKGPIVSQPPPGATIIGGPVVQPPKVIIPPSNVPRQPEIPLPPM